MTMAKKNTQYGVTVTENKDGSYAVHFEGMTVGKVLALNNALRGQSGQSAVCYDLSVQLRFRIEGTPTLAIHV